MYKNKILVVDEKRLDTIKIKEKLEKFGYKILTATTGKEAVKIAIENNPEIILIDLQLTGKMSGIEAVKKIHSYRNIPIIYMTDYWDEEILEKVKLTNPYGFILKPLKIIEINANIQMAIYKHQSDSKKREFSERITAIIPAYNEQVTIGSVVLKTKMYVNRVIVVDDGSTDKTVEIAVLAGAEIIRHKTNMGKGKALKTGFEVSKGAQIIVTLDADGQHRSSDIPKLVKPIIDGEADIVNGSRYIDGNDKNTPSYRRVGQTVLDKATNFNAKTKITDSQSGLRAFASYTIPAFKFRETGYGIESEMIIEASNAGFKIVEVPIGVRYDVDGSKMNPLSHGIGVLVKVLQDIEFNRPLYYFTLPGVIMIAIGLISGLIFFGSYLDHRSSSLAPTTLAALLTIAGTFIAFTGIILHSISRMIERVLDN
ncbi:glycosyltransferase [Methanobacterium spitsbergense]|uniref:Glycosyltransferase n=1 Tax=Methanobacterium spitsbergense TaxID=2874285 RepID=A0A8T5V403_9EURY|nr:glycosyltransferase [Methanobacterium spitsbergense]MBZ2166395.1 glycosyltransferase [Methanobacterium spitsbergense]